MEKPKITSIKLQKQLHFKMQQRIINDGYGMRGKTKWIIEAIEKFLTIPDFLDFVDIADEASHLEENLSLRLPEETFNKLENALLKVRTSFPMMEGVKSKLVRASITQRIVRG